MPFLMIRYSIRSMLIAFCLNQTLPGTLYRLVSSYATARDFARFGLLYYNNGMWNGTQSTTARLGEGVCSTLPGR